MPRPKSIPKDEVCSECGLSWSRHPENATKSDCVRLLKADLKAADWRVKNAEWRAAQKPYYPYWSTYPNETWRLRENIEGTKTVRALKWPSVEGEWKTETKPYRITTTKELGNH